jgi:2-keto-4-pentenoate hydratase/2-oxohepta-3-ene-1,7-dioic acid hydratase in catechol pathway
MPLDAYAGGMRVVRVWVDGLEVHGVVVGDEVRLLAQPPFSGVEYRGDTVQFNPNALLAPVLPSKVVCVGKNYADHAAEMGGEVPAEPVIFLKPPTSVVAPGAPIILPSQSQEVHHEAELAVVIGRRCHRITAAEAADFVFGYTVANDVTARDLQRSDQQWTRAKGFDTFCPIGPWIETDFDPKAARVTCVVDGQTRQDGNTRDLVRSAADMVAWISQVMTLLPGDVVLTGTPAGVGPLQAGQTVVCTVDGIGSLSNPVVLA